MSLEVPQDERGQCVSRVLNQRPDLVFPINQPLVSEIKQNLKRLKAEKKFNISYDNTERQG
jgi:hypothetical protein